MLKRLLIPLSAVCLLVSCGDESSSNSSTQPEFVESSSSLEQEVESSSSEKLSSSSAKSSSVKASSSSAKQIRASSSSVKEYSSSKKTKSSSSWAKEGSSSVKDDKSSASEKNSSSEKKDESSSSENKSSSSEKEDESSSSEASSSSVAPSSSPEESSSSEELSSSSVVENSSSSLESTGVCKTKTEDNCVYGSLYDERDGKTYKTVKIGEQEWMAENLRYVDSTQSVCYANNSDNCQIYGRLYTRNGALNNCPEGWRLPSEKDWLDLRDFAKKNSTNKYIGQLFRADTLWNVSELGVGYDAFGFGALPAGGYDEDGWWGVKTNSIFWLSDSYKIGTLDCFVYTRIRYKLKDNSDIQIGKEVCVQNPNSYFSVRCIKD